MRFKRPIYRYLFYTAWIVAIGGIVTLLASANRQAKARTCKGVMVSINNGGEKIYVEKEDVLKSIEQKANGSIVSKNTGDINLALLENALEKNPWIRDAELYFDTKDVLHVAVLERVPVARVFTVAGTSFYMDSAGHQLPLLESYSAKLPVVTGFTAAKRMNKADSLLLQETKEVVQTISNDAFWSAQVGQIDITPDRKFELIPVLGSHVIRLGSGTNAAAKLARLMVFYKQVLPKAGFAKYSALDVQFEGQVVAVRRGAVSTVDSIQLQKNIAELMKKKAAEQEPDDAAPVVTNVATLSNGDFDPVPGTADSTAVRTVAKGTSTIPATTAAAKTVSPVEKPATQRPAPAKATTGQKPVVKKAATSTSNPVQKPKTNKQATATKPKAVMPKKAENEY